ncbi:hypothetical protein SmJEL517_g02921 [Synchytrium microbalum]|uniref:Cytochrome P450 n=1 Tax=Synchytrium microbalum TaxID=1806994 RepID=A0A507C0C3_9FUNG|nr:uncharacterized protein SmJEL517_g02921 [Synchytrium microbalum]TPX34527.1 hypothetical protein SmJEL517_g02921 [Synchytrium microbalum]
MSGSAAMDMPEWIKALFAKIKNDRILLYTTIGLSATAITVGSVSGLVYLMTRSKHAKIPGPVSHPIHGNMDIKPYEPTRAAHEFFTAMFKRYGSPIIRIQNGLLANDFESLWISDATEARRVLTSKKQFIKADFFLRSSGIEHGLVSLSGAEHDRHRNLLKPALSTPHLTQICIAAADLTNDLVQIWMEKCEQGPVDVAPAFMSMATDVLGRVFFGYEFENVASLGDGVKHESTRAFIAAADHWNGLAGLRAMKSRWMYSYYKCTDKDVQYALAPIYALFKSLMDDKRKAKASGCPEKPEQEKDLLERLLSKDQEGQEKFSDIEIMEEMISFYIAGRETSGATMTWLFYELAHNPELIPKAQQEIDEIFAQDGAITYETIPKFKYLQRILKETLRLHTPLPQSQSRKALEDTEVAGQKVHAGTRVMVYLRAMHLNEQYWPEPYKFDPERFNQKPDDNTYMPFGAGVYMCIGQKVAETEILTVVAIILRHFDIELVPDQKFQTVQVITVRLRGGLMLKLTPRKNKRPVRE